MAAAVAGVIRDTNSVNVIGLLGGWGSGKSTVVRHIAKNLAEHPSKEAIHLFTFDAWLHQNDPPRRAFLEALIRDLTSHALVDEENWRPRLADLSGRSEETETETSRSLSETGKWIFLSLVFVPLGLGLLDFDLIDKAFGSTPDLLAKWTFWTSLVLTIAPVLVVTTFYLSWRPWRQLYRSDGIKLLMKAKFWTEHKSEHANQSILALLTNQSVERSVNTTKISPEPTAIEFREVFRDLLRALQGHKKRLVIVIDNLDRLAEADAMQLWATIRSLFLGDDASLPSGEGLRSPAIILPIDSSAVARMFSISHPAEAQELAEAFIDKTFDITFNVNEPVMSDWRAYLSEKLQEAFGEAATPDRIYWATKIVEEQLVEGGLATRITPRKLIKLVNSVGGLVAQWGDGVIDFISMVFYVVRRTSIASDVRAFVNSDWPSMDAAVDEWKRQIAALHFGVAPGKAFQALLHEPLRLAITANDRAEFDKLIQTEGAWAIAEGIVENPPDDAKSGAPEANFVANAALLISACAQADEFRSRRLLITLSKHWIKSVGIGIMRPDFPEIINSFSSSLATNTAPFLVASTRTLGAAMDKSSLDDGMIKSFAGSIAALESLAASQNVSLQPVPLAIDTKGLFALLRNLPTNHRRYIRTDKTSTEIITALGAALIEPDSSSDVPEVVRALASPVGTMQLKDKAKLDWDSIANSAFAALQANPLSFHATGPAIDVLGLLQSINKTAETLVAQSFDQGRLSALLNEADQAEDADRLADLATLMLVRGTDFPGPNGKTWDQVLKDHPEFGDKVRSALAWYLWSDDTTYALQATKTRPSFRPVISELARLDVVEHDSDGITTSYLLSNLEPLMGDIGEELLNKCIADASKRQDFWPALDELKNGPGYDGAIARLSKVAQVDKDQLIAAIGTRLNTTDANAWRGAIVEGVAPYQLAQIFHSEFGQIGPLGDNLKSALSEVVHQLLQADDGMRKRWFLLIAFVSKGVRATMLRNLRDALLAGSAVSRLDKLISFGGETLMREGKFSDESDKTARHVILPLISDEGGQQELRSLATLFKPILSNCDPDTKAAILEALDALNAPDENDGLRLKAALGLT